MQRKISVVIAVFNKSKYIRECMESIVRQTFHDIEIICVDDGSTDGSVDILREYKQLDDRITIIQQQNQGAGAARNRGMRAASGEYIIFWDADDYFREDALEKMYARAKETDADVVICDNDIWDGENSRILASQGKLEKELIPQDEVFSGEDIPDRLFLISPGWAWNKLCRMELVRENDIAFQEDIVTSEDNTYSLVVLAVAKKITAVREKLIRYRRYTKESLEDRLDQYWKSRFASYEALLNKLYSLGIAEIYRRSLDNFIAENIINTLDGDFSSFKAYAEFFKRVKEDIIPRYRLDQHENAYFLRSYVYERIKKIQEEQPEKYLLDSSVQMQRNYEELSNNTFNLNNYNNYIMRRYEMGMRIFGEWVRVKQTGNDLIPYFHDNCLKTIAIYGMGILGERLFDELEDSDITVLYAIDRMAEQKQYKGLKIYGTKDDCYPEVDAVCVTPTQDYWDIVCKLSAHIDAPIISLEDVTGYCAALCCE